MKKGKRVLSLLLVMMLLMALISGCGTPAASTASTTGGSGFSEPPYEVIIQTITFGSKMNDLALVEEAINAISLPAINCTVKLQVLGIPTFNTETALKIADGEKIDLAMVGLTTNLSSMVSTGMLLPISDQLTAKGQGLTTMFGDMLKAGQIDGVQYAVPADPYPAAGTAFMYNKDIADKYSIVVPEQVGFAELDTIFAQLKAADPVLFGYTSYATLTGSGYFYNIGAYGDTANLTYGVTLNPDTNNTVINWYASPEYRTYCLKMKEWQEKGFIPSDSLTNLMAASNLLKAGTIFSCGTAYSPRELVAQAKSYSFAIGMAQSTPGMISNETLKETMWGIPITSKNPEKAMEMLNLMYTNADIGNLLCNGIEGRQYVAVSDNVIKLPDGVKAGNSGYYKTFSRFGDTMKIKQFVPATEEFYNDLKAFNDNAKKTLNIGYSFNTESVSSEVAAVTNVIAEFRPALECGVAGDVDAALAKFTKALDDAGYGKIIAENQRQLDEWLAKQ